MTSNIENSLDNILVELGDFGKYQIFVFGLVCYAVTLYAAADVSYIFIAMDLNYRCAIPTCDSDIPEYNPPWLIDAVPYKEGVPKKCDMFENINDSSEIDSRTCSSKDFDRNITVRCSSFIYKGPEKTILQKYNLHCDENLWKLTMMGSINNLGQFFGQFISGVISDKYGRRALLVGGMVSCAIFSIMQVFTYSYEWFTIFELLDGIVGSGTYICGFVLGVELVGPKKRVLIGILICCCYALGEIFVAVAAWIVKSWIPLTYIIHLPRFLLLFYFCILPESLRWNISKGRIEETKRTLRKVAKVNGKELSEEVLEQLDHSKFDELEKEQTPFRDVLKSRKLMLRMVNCGFSWVACTLLFFGLNLNSVSLDAENRYVDFILTALVEIPAYIFCNYILDVFGRRKSLSATYLVAGIACISSIFLSSETRAGNLAIYLVGKFAATAAFAIVYVVTSEIFPTNLRHSFMGICSGFGRLGSVIAPQTPLLAQLWAPLPMISFATVAGVAGFLALLLPETLNKRLPDTIEEAENISKLNLNIPAKRNENYPLIENSVAAQCLNYNKG